MPKPMHPSQIVTAGLSEVGRVRSENQDAIGELCLDDPAQRILAVADGMGGHRGGQVASRMALDGLLESLADAPGDPPARLRHAVERANARVHAASLANPDLLGMGTTLVCLLFDESDHAWVAHVGDSRAYRLRDDTLQPLTQDHSVVGELVRRGRLSAEEARLHPQRNELLRAIGTQPEVQVEIQSVGRQAGDRFLLCSDGLCGLVEDTEIAERLAAAEPEAAARALVERANELGGTDNISVEIARLAGGAGGTSGRESAPSWPRRLGWLALVAAGAALAWRLWAA